MIEDLTALDSYGWEALKRTLNQRVVLDRIRLVPSKKNRVWIVETDVRPVVVKRSLTGKCGVEFESLLIARQRGLAVPYPLWKQDDYIVMEYVPGEGCELLVNNMFSSKAAEGIGRWLSEFHSGLEGSSQVTLMGDAVLSNFIMGDNGVFGVDLEDTGPGDPLEDLGKISASVLGSEPFFTPIKFDLCLKMIASYDKRSSTDFREKVRPFISKHLRLDSKARPLFRRTFVAAARSLEKGWPSIA